MITGATILCFFLYFDAMSSLSEETKDVISVISQAIFLTIMTGRLIFIFVAYVYNFISLVCHVLSILMPFNQILCCL